ncbi:unnamed protein product [Alopecurus aequalis]
MGLLRGFSVAAVMKRMCKAALKKGLSDLFLGDLDLDQLDLQLTGGTLRLTDLALNADFINAQLSGFLFMVKEGSIKSLLVKFPLQLKSCEIVVEDLELVLASSVAPEVPPVDAKCSVSGNTQTSTSVDIKINGSDSEHASTSASRDVDEDMPLNTSRFALSASKSVTGSRENLDRIALSQNRQDRSQDSFLTKAHVIQGWIPELVVNEDQGVPDSDCDESINQFFECFEELRNSQTNLGNSGIWDWTCSVFNAITFASTLASGSDQVPKGASSVSASLFNDMRNSEMFSSCLSSGQLEQSMMSPATASSLNMHHLEAKCQNIHLELETYPGNLGFKASIAHMKLDEYYSTEKHNSSHSHVGTAFLNNNFCREVQAALPQFPFAAQDYWVETAGHFSHNSDKFIKVEMLKTFGECTFHYDVSNTDQDGSNSGSSTSLSIYLAPLIFWVHFHTVYMILNFISKVDVVHGKHKLYTDGDENLTNISLNESLKVQIVPSHARIILCFPDEPSWDLSRPSILDKFLVVDHTSSQKASSPLRNERSNDGNPSTPSTSFHLATGNFDIYFVKPVSVFDGRIDPLSRQTFSALKIFSVTRSDYHDYSIRVIRKSHPVNCPEMVNKAWSLPNLHNQKITHKENNKWVGVASSTTSRDLAESCFTIRQELIQSTEFLLHVQLPCVSVHLNKKDCGQLNQLLDLILDGLSDVATGSSENGKDKNRESAIQTSVIFECSMLNICTELDETVEVGPSLQTELEGSWNCLKLSISELSLCSFSNVGGVNNSSFLWMNHGEDSAATDFDVELRDLGLLICGSSDSKNVTCGYDVDYLRQMGYAKIGHNTFIEASVRVDTSFWKLEISESQFDFGTCRDTTYGLVRLVSQLQKLYSPDMRDALAHLQSRWNTVQQANTQNMAGAASDMSESSTDNLADSGECKSDGLLDDIIENAFYSDQAYTAYSFWDRNCHNSLSSSAVQLESHISLGSSLVTPEDNSYDVASKAVDCDDGGWFSNTPLTIVESHVSTRKNPHGEHVFQQEGNPAVHSLSSNESCNPKGKILIHDIDVKWRMYAGDDWSLAQNDSTSRPCSNGRDTSSSLEFIVSGLGVHFDMYPYWDVSVSKLSISAHDLILCDQNTHAPWKMVLGCYDSKNYPRESCSTAFTLELESVRPEPQAPLEDYRLCLEILPLQIHLDQGQLNFLISFFQNNSSNSNLHLPCENETVLMDSTTYRSSTIVDEALLPFFQKFHMKPLVLHINYIPRQFDPVALGKGNYAELLNILPWKGINLKLKNVCAMGVYGWNSICEIVAAEWLEDISKNQVHKLLKGLPPIKSLLAVGSGTKKLVSLPIKSYKKDRKFLKGMQRDYIRANQPESAHQGLKQAYESLTDGLGRTASALIGNPIKVYNRGGGPRSVLSTAIRGAPAAAVAPVSASARALHYALLGLRNSLDPEHKKESAYKYSGP